MTNPDTVIAKLNAEIAIERECGNVDLTTAPGCVLVQARDMILTLMKERDAAEIAHVELGYN
jgi:hypothetical protein